MSDMDDKIKKRIEQASREQAYALGAYMYGIPDPTPKPKYTELEQQIIEACDGDSYYLSELLALIRRHDQGRG